MATEQQRKIFIGNVNYDAREDELKAFLEEAGCPPVRVQMPLDKATGRQRGFAFAEFESPTAAQEAMAQLNYMHFMGRPLKVNIAQDRSERTPELNGLRGTGGGHYRRHEPRW